MQHTISILHLESKKCLLENKNTSVNIPQGKSLGAVEVNSDHFIIENYNRGTSLKLQSAVGNYQLMSVYFVSGEFRSNRS
jgi:hypothetical protein